MRGDKHPLGQMFLIGAIVSAIGIAIGLAIDWFPADATTKGGEIDTLYDVLVIVSVPIFVLVMTIVIYSVTRFKARPGDKSDGPPIHGSARLEVVWVLVPFLIVSVLAVYAWIVLDDVEAKKKDEMVVDVYGQQFAWHFAYPQAGGKPVASTELMLPKDRPVYFRIHADDVIHSFWVPEFRLKQDAVPGMTTHMRLTPNRLGNYEVVCTELCGLGHSTMRQAVKVVPPGDFQTWLQKQKAGGGGGNGATASTGSAAGG
jgi:cytochrome c oxidase subunit 2